MKNQFKIILVSSFVFVSFIQCEWVANWQAASLLNDLGYSKNFVDKRISTYKLRAPFSAESQLLVDIYSNKELRKRVSERNLIIEELLLLEGAFSTMQPYMQQTVYGNIEGFSWSKEKDFFSKGMVLEAYLLLTGKVGIETGKRAPTMLAHRATELGATVEILQLLLARGGEINIVDVAGATILMKAVEQQRVDLIDLALLAGADANSVNKKGDTAFIIALMTGYLPAINMLIERDAMGNSDRTEEVAFKSLLEKSVSDESLYEAVLKFLVGRGALEKVIGGMTPLMVTARDNNIGMAQLLLSNGAQVNRSVNGVSPVRLAFLGGHRDMALLLLKNKANINDIDSNGETLLHGAAKQGQTESVRELIKLGASVNTFNKKGWTPVAEAVVGGHAEIVQLILKNGGWQTARIKVGGKLPQELAWEKGYTNIFGMLGGYY